MAVFSQEEWGLQVHEYGICSTCCGISAKDASVMVLFCGSTSSDNPSNIGFPATLEGANSGAFCYNLLIFPQLDSVLVKGPVPYY